MHLTRILLPALVVGALLLAACGDGSTGTPSGNAADRAFVAAMIPHHQSAVAMAKIAQGRGSSAFVRRLADAIVRTQTQEIATMRARDRALAAAGVKRGSLGMSEHMMGMGGDTASLRTARPFDQAFMRMMIPHHRGAVVMADAVLKNGTDPELETLARRIVTAQQREIREMREQLGDSRAGPMHADGAAHEDEQR